MANFCYKCGAALDTATGLCPTCDREKLQAMKAETPAPVSRFCGICGSTMDEQTGLCSNPACTTKAPAAVEEPAPQPVEEVEKPIPQPAEEVADTPIVVDIQPKKKTKKAVTTIITVCLSICLFFTALFALLIGDVRHALSEDTAEKLLENIEVTDLLGTTDATAGSDLETFYRRLEQYYDIEITDSKLNSFVERSTIKSFLADEMADFCTDFFEGEAEWTITKREVVNLLKRNADLIENKFDVSLTTTEIEEIADLVFDGDEVEIMTTDTLKDTAPALYYMASIGLSYVTMAAFIILSALLILVMAKNDLCQAACGTGIVFIIIGALASVVALFAAWIPPLWEAICGGSFIGIFIGNFVSANALSGVILLVLGIALLVGRVLLLRFRARKAGKTA